MDTSTQQMPMRLENFFGNLNKNNMQRRLFSIYKWNVGRSEASYDDFYLWLKNIGDWLESQPSSNTRSAEKETTETKETTESTAAEKDANAAPV